MGLFFWKKKQMGQQPHQDWPWILSVGGMPRSSFGWVDVARALRELVPDTDSFVILEQKNGNDYWYFQSAIALRGPHAGKYVVGCGWPGAEGPRLVEWYGSLEEALTRFEAVWKGKPVDFSGCEDQSDWLNS